MAVPSQFTHASEPTMRLLSFSILLVVGTDMLLTVPLLPLLQREFGASVSRSGWLVSAYILGYALFVLITGPTSDRLDRRKVLLAGLAGFGVFAAACGRTWGFRLPLATHLLADVVAAFAASQIRASIPVTVPPKAIVKTMGYATTGLAIAQVVDIPIASFLSLMGWRISFFAIAASNAALWTILYKDFPSVVPATSDGRLLAPYTHIAHSYPLLMLPTAYLLFQTGNFTVLSSIGSQLTEDLGTNQSATGTTMIIIGLGSVAGPLAGSRLIARLGERCSLSPGIIVLNTIYLGTAFVSNMQVAITILAVVIPIGGFLSPVLMSGSQSHTDLARDTVSLLASAVMYAGVTTGETISGCLLSKFIGCNGAAMSTTVAYVVSLGMYAFGGAFRRDSE